MKFKVLNNEPIQFYNTNGTLVATFEVSGSGDLLIKPTSGSSKNIILGDRDSASDIEIGLTSVESGLKLMGGGTISSNGKTLNIGDAGTDDLVIINSSQLSSSFSGSFEGSITSTTVTFPNLSTSEPTVTGSVWISGSSVAHPNSGYLMIFNP